MTTVLLLEPFYGGSHKQLIDWVTNLLKSSFDVKNTVLLTLPAAKWHWKARCSALMFADSLPKLCELDRLVVFASSVLNLAELVALQPRLMDAIKILYFHENQLLYPVRRDEIHDFQFGYNQILSCLTADLVLFNSHFNMSSFLDGVGPFLNKIPGYKNGDEVATKIRDKCRVLYFPVQFPQEIDLAATHRKSALLHIVWPHRWEYDKCPELFFDCLIQLAKNSECPRFALSVLGESFGEKPACFTTAFVELSSKVNIVNWGPIEDKREYFALLRDADVVVSTANHEFFGVAMIEAAFCGCYPLCPNNLVYPEIFPKDCLYNTRNQLLRRLVRFCQQPLVAREERTQLNIDFSKFSAEHLANQYKQLFS